VLYGTTDAFLEHFGLGAIGDLPGMSDLKAAGLLEARLPPGFSVPTPSDEDDETFEEDAEEAEFAHDFLEDAEEQG
jgi:segregation and condensation protein B